MEQDVDRSRVVVAGASGFVGRALPAVCADGWELVGLSRRPECAGAVAPGYQWRSCDLFSRRQTIDALEGATCAVYLAHSMGPDAGYTQAHSRNTGVLCADNFARGCRDHGVEQIVYVGGIVPEAGELSPHLSGRREIEETLGSYGTPVTTIRAGLVLGPGSATADIIVRLVQRLPVIVLPAWTDGEVCPISRADVAELVAFVLGREEWFDTSSDVGGPERLSFRDILKFTAELAGRKLRGVTIGFDAPAVSTWWVSALTGHPRARVRPLIESMRHRLDPGDRRLQEAAGQQPRSFRDTMREVLQHAVETAEEPARNAYETDDVHEVRSVQRLPAPRQHSARWVAREYARWLPRFMRPFLRVERSDDDLRFFVFCLPSPVLVLHFDHGVSGDDRQLYWVGEGLLAGQQEGGRLEFRSVLGGRWVLAALHDFRPRLPWLVYRMTQAQIHLLVMHAFARHLGRAGPKLLESDDDEAAWPDSAEILDGKADS